MQYDLVHANTCDFEVGTSAASPEACAEQLAAFIRSGQTPRALRWLAERSQGAEECEA
jgi:hypothetical protein